MAEHDTAQARAPAEEARALGDLASIEVERDTEAEMLELAVAFDAAVAADLEQHPALVLYPGTGALHRAAIARVARVTLRVAHAQGNKGIRLDLLKRIYQALEVPPRIAEVIERKLTTDGVGGVSCGRLYFTGDRATWSRLAQTRAE